MEIESVEELFYARTKRRCLFNITAIENIPSIMQHGIVSYDLAKKLPHRSIAIEDVQERRSKRSVTNGPRLHQYANLYFTYHNPMMYKRRGVADTICVLAISASVLDIEDCVVSDMNAAASLARFYPAAEGIGVLDFVKIFATNWNYPDDKIRTRSHRAIKCAEILIPNVIPFSFIAGAYVVSEDSNRVLEEMKFPQRIIVKPSVFFQ